MQEEEEERRRVLSSSRLLLLMCQKKPGEAKTAFSSFIHTPFADPAVYPPPTIQGQHGGAAAAASVLFPFCYTQ